MDFNVLKCAITSITLKRPPSISEYKMKQQLIPRVDHHNYLGVTINNKSTWDSHTKKITAKAQRTLGMLRRNLHSCSQEIKSLAYLTLVRPQLEYASCAWSAHTAKHVELIECVQNASARFATGEYSKYASVSGFVQKLKWKSLEHRRLMEELTMFYKIERGFVNMNFPSVVLPSRTSTTRWSDDRQKAVIGTSLNAYKHSHFIRTIPRWNRIPASCADAVNCKSFTCLQLRWTNRCKELRFWHARF